MTPAVCQEFCRASQGTHNGIAAAMRCASGDHNMNACSLARQLVLACALPMLFGCGGGGSSGVAAGVGVGIGTGTGSGTAPGAPQVTLTAPANLAAGLNGALALGATASDDVGVTRVEFEVDGLPAGSDASAPIEASVNTADFVAGQHMVRARAHGAAGSVSAWATAMVRFGGSNSVSAGFTRNESFVDGLSSATALAQASDGRLFIAEQGGALHVFKAGQLLALHFGSDGKLYAGVGDNSNPANSQDLTSPFGKLLRFNDDGSIPADNPFFTTPQNLASAIWAYGLRNPFTFAVQPGTGRIHINDVGEITWEEVNLGVAGANFGWPNSEGPDKVSASSVAPLFTYEHSAAAPPGSGPGGFFTGFAIAGGAFYPATGMFAAPYRGNYFFADFIGKSIGRLDLANGNAAYAFASINDSPVDMLVADDGALLVLGRAGVTRIRAP
jgi:glucose/arabinose dehydrogenase